VYIPYQRRVLNTKRKKLTLGLHFMFLPFGYLLGGIPFVTAAPMNDVFALTPTIMTLLQIGTMVISLSTGFTSAAFYHEKRTTNKIADASKIQAEKLEDLKKVVERMERNLCDSLGKQIAENEKNTDIKILNTHTMINNVSDRLERVEDMFWNRGKGEHNI
jgi:hypothetical protein